MIRAAFEVRLRQIIYFLNLDHPPASLESGLNGVPEIKEKFLEAETKRDGKGIQHFQVNQKECPQWVSVWRWLALVYRRFNLTSLGEHILSYSYLILAMLETKAYRELAQLKARLKLLPNFHQPFVVSNLIVPFTFTSGSIFQPPSRTSLRNGWRSDPIRRQPALLANRARPSRSLPIRPAARQAALRARRPAARTPRAARTTGPMGPAPAPPTADWRRRRPVRRSAAPPSCTACSGRRRSRARPPTPGTTATSRSAPSSGQRTSAPTRREPSPTS